MKITKTTLKGAKLHPGVDVWQYRNNFWSYYYCEEETDIGFTFLGMSGIILKDRPVLLVENSSTADEITFNKQITEAWDEPDYEIMIAFRN